MKPVLAIAAAMVIASATAYAQGTPSTGGTVNVSQCWDTVAGRVKDRMPGVTVTSPNDKSTVGSTASESSASAATSPEGSSGKGTSTEAVKAASARPPGIPDC